MEDRTNITKTVDKNGKESISYSKSWKSNGLNHSKEIRKVEGGYIVTESKYGTPNDGDEKADYVDERKEYVTTENPLKIKEEDKKEEQKMFDFIDKPTF